MADISLNDIRTVYSFNGTSNCVAVGHFSDYNIQNAITIECRLKPGDTASTYRAVLSKGTAYRFYHGWSVGAYPVLNLYIDTIYPQVGSLNPLTATNFHHIAGTYDSDASRRSLRIYIDGDLDNEGNQLSGLGSYTINTNATGVYLVRYSGIYGYGQFDYIRLYNVELTAREIKNNYQGNYTKRGLVSWWRFNEGTGSVAYDSGPGKHNGTIY